MVVVASGATILAEDEGWSVFLPGVPVGADGATFGAAVDNMIDALREYAADWRERLRDAPNQRAHEALVQAISVSTDDQLREWLQANHSGS